MSARAETAGNRWPRGMRRDDAAVSPSGINGSEAIEPQQVMVCQSVNPATSNDETVGKPGKESENAVAALFVETGGCYFDLPGVDPWDHMRDARLYEGPHPVVAHPPCERWGRFWHGSTRKPHQFRLGEDGGCFDAALYAVQKFGGVLEHPADSHAWGQYEINRPPKSGGWVCAGFPGAWTCHVEQGFYGHFSRKPTWLLACSGPALKIELPELRWGRGEQRLHPVALERHGYEKARRIGMVAMIGGKDKTKIRNATPIPFRDLLLSIARSVNSNRWVPSHGHTTAFGSKCSVCGTHNVRLVSKPNPPEMTK